MIIKKNNGLGKIGPAVIGMVSGATQGEAPPERKRSFFGRLWRSTVRTAIGTFLGDGVLKEIESWVGAIERGSFEVGYADEDGNAIISDYEASIIESWLINNFAPKYKAMLEKANEIFTSKNLQKQIDLINELNNELAVLKEYLKWDNPKLSLLAQNTRNEFVSELITEIEHIIFKTIEASENVFVPFDNKLTSTPSLLFPIISYVRFDAVATNYLLSNDVQNPIDLDNPIDENNTADTTDVTEPVATITKKASGLPWWVWLAGAWAGYKILK